MPYKQFYLVPLVTVNGTRGFKYMQTPEVVGFQNYSGMDYGNEDEGLVSLNAELVDHNSLASNTDVFQFPLDLTTNVSSRDIKNLKKELNNRNFASEWILPNKPYSGVVRNIAKSCMVNQRFQGKFNSNIVQTKDLKKRGKDLDKAIRNQLDLVTDEIGITRNRNARLEIHLKDLMEAIPTKDKNGKGIMCNGVEL